MDWLKMLIVIRLICWIRDREFVVRGEKGLVEELDVLGFYFYGGGEVACGEGDE